MSYFNWKLATVLFMGAVVLISGVFALNYVQRTGRINEYYELGTAAFEQENWQQAADQLGKYITLDRTNIEVLTKYAQAQLRIRPRKPGQWQQAVGAYREVLRLDKGHREAAEKLLEIYLQSGTAGEAEMLARRYLENSTDPDSDAEVKRLLAVALISQRELEAAGELLESIVQEHPDHVRAYDTLGRLADQHSELFDQNSQSWYDLAVSRNPESAEAYVSRAYHYFAHQKRAEAKEDIDKAAQLDLSDHEIHLIVAKGYLDIGDTESAKRHLDLVYEQEPGSLRLWQIRGQLAIRSESVEQMREVADGAMAHLNEDAVWDYLMFAAELYVRAGIYDKAEDCLKRLEDQDLKLPTVTFLKGLIAYQHGDYHTAVQSWKNAVSLGYQSMQIRLLLASAYEKIGNLLSARKVLELAVSENPSSVAARLALARHLEKINDWHGVKEQVQAILSMSPDTTEAQLLSVEADINLGSYQMGFSASRHFEMATQSLDALAETIGETNQVNFLRFQLHLKQDHLAEAEESLSQIQPETDEEKAKVALAWAALLREQQNVDQAITKLENAVQAMPESSTLIRSLAALWIEQGNREAAERLLRDTLDRLQNPSAKLELALMLADAYSTQWHDDDKAQAFLEDLNERYPDSIVIKRRLLSCPKVAKDRERAQSIVEQIRSLEGQEGWQWRYEQARHWFNQSNFEDYYTQAVALLKENLTINSGDQASRILLAAMYERAGKPLLAVAIYREALDRSPYNLNIIVLAVSALQKVREYEEADELLTRAASIKARSEELDKLKVKSYLYSGKFDSAAGLLETFWNTDPNYTQAGLSLVMLRMQQREFKEAGELLNRVRNTAREDSLLTIDSLRVQLLMNQKRQQEALQLCNELIARYDDPNAYILRARTHAAMGNADAAIEDFDLALQRVPQDAELWTAKSEMCLSLKRVTEALDAVDRALTLDKDNPAVQKQAINVFILSQREDRIKQAEAMVEQALKTFPDDVKFKIQEIELLLNQGSSESLHSVEEKLAQLTRTHPQSRYAWLYLGEFFLRRDEPDKAIDVVVRGLSNLRNDKALLQLKVRAELRESPIMAAQTLQHVLELDPYNAEIAVQLADTYLKAENPSKAVSVLQDYLRTTCPEESQRDCQFALVKAQLANNQRPEAMGQLAILMQADPQDPRLLTSEVPYLIRQDRLDTIEQKTLQWLRDHSNDETGVLAVASELMKTSQKANWAVAESLLREAVARQGESSAKLFLLAQLRQMQEDLDGAGKIYRRILKLDNKHVVALNNLAWILTNDNTKYEEALALVERGLAIEPYNRDLLDTHGQVCLRLGRYDDAIKSLTEAIRLYSNTAPQAVASRYFLAQSYAAKGNDLEAIDYLRQCLDRNRLYGGLNPRQQTEAVSLLASLTGRN